MKQPAISRIIPLIIVLFAFIQFSNTLGHDFAWDDRIVITENERVQKGVSGIPDLFVKYNSQLMQDKYGYRPITLTTFAVDYELFEDNPAGYHFMNVLYFSLLCMVLFFVLRRIFERFNPLLPFLVVILFIAHPLHSEVVANIKSRDEILAMLFGFLSLYYFLEFYAHQKLKHVLFSIVFFLLAFLSRENAIAFVAILPLAVFVQSKLDWNRLIRSSFVLPVIGIAAFVILYLSMSSELGVERTAELGVYEEDHILGNSFFHTAGFFDRISNAFHLIFLYLKNFLAPYPLTYYSGSNQIPVLGFNWMALVSALLTIGALVFSVWKMKRYPMIAFGLLFFLITLAPYLHVLQTLSDTMADRFMFMPSFGLCIALIGALAVFFKIPLTSESDDNKETLSFWKQFNAKPIAFRGILVVLVVVFSGMTFSRNGVWKDNFTLVTSDLPHLENCARAHYYYATELNKKMMEDKWSLEDEEEMIEHYRRSIELSDEIYYGRLELATYLCNQRRLDEGIQLLEEAVKRFPETSDPRYYLGQAYYDTQQYAKAVTQLEKSVELAPGYYDAYHVLALALAKTGNFNRAVKIAQTSLAKFPETAVTYYSDLGAIYFDQGDMDKSTNCTLKMIELGGNAHDGYATIIGRYQVKKDDEKALFYYQKAIELGIMQPAQR